MNIRQIEKVINDPQILKGSFVANNKTPVLDMERFGKKTIWMMTNKGGWAFIPCNIGVYECHFGYNRKGLGQFALDHSKECFHNMENLGAVKLLGIVASQNKLAKRFLEKLGCVSVRKEKGNYKFSDKKTDLEVYQWRS